MDLAELLHPWSWVPDSRGACPGQRSGAASGTTISLGKRHTHEMNEAVTPALASRPAPAPAAGEGGPAASESAPAVGGAALDSAIARATQALLTLQQPDGHWVFELEA